MNLLISDDLAQVLVEEGTRRDVSMAQVMRERLSEELTADEAQHHSRSLCFFIDEDLAGRLKHQAWRDHTTTHELMKHYVELSLARRR